jgi:hypothetical protein
LCYIFSHLQYIVGRASIEPNFHDLYLKFLDKINSKGLQKEIIKATYENCKVYTKALHPFPWVMDFFYELGLGNF